MLGFNLPVVKCQVDFFYNIILMANEMVMK